MKVFAAIDLKGGVVVRGIGGRRDEYAPLQSCLAESAQPPEVASGLADGLGIRDLYVADLDAIAGAQPSWALFEELIASDRLLWIDAGVADVDRGSRLKEFSDRCPEVTGIIVGLESIGSGERLRQLCEAVDPRRLVFSLDLKAGRPLGAIDDWGDADAMTIVRDVIELGIRRLIVLDLAAVGEEAGCTTLELCRSLRSEFPEVEIASGGGVRNCDDLRALADAGCHAALVASALHDGGLSRDDLRVADSFGQRE